MGYITSPTSIEHREYGDKSCVASTHALQTSDQHLKPTSKRRKARSLLRKWKRISFRHTWLNPLILALIILGAYFVNPGPQNPLHSAIYLSYPLGPDYPGGPNMYGKGKLDIAFVAFYTIILTFTREFIMQRVIKPWALYCGIRTRAKQARFMEQVYTAMYFSIFGPFGLYVMKQGTLWYFNTTAMFEGFPHRTHEGVFKAYYLLQASYWTQQAVVLMLQLEKPRKDFKELVFHHIVTLFLIALSYRFHFAKMGIAVYITMDISDFFLATSKTLNYLDSSLVGPYYITFIGVWVYLRHYLNLRILWATLTEFKTVGPYELNWETQQYKCWISQIITFSLLAALQAVNLFWLFLILRIAKNFVFNDNLADERSDDEAETETKEEETKSLANGKHTPPTLLVNGKDADSVPQPEGMRTRSRKKA
jgi:very-long-chain ceramide synthase